MAMLTCGTKHESTQLSGMKVKSKRLPARRALAKQRSDLVVVRPTPRQRDQSNGQQREPTHCRPRLAYYPPLANFCQSMPLHWPCRALHLICRRAQILPQPRGRTLPREKPQHLLASKHRLGTRTTLHQLRGLHNREGGVPGKNGRLASTSCLSTAAGRRATAAGRRLAPQACPECGTRYLPRGSWCLFLDDVTSVAWPDHFSLHELVMLGFLTAQQKRVHPGV